MTSPLEKRLGAVEARIAIGDLVNRYFQRLDQGDFAGVAQLFAPEAVFEYPGGSVEGRHGLERFFAAQLEKYDAWWHYGHGHVVELVDGRAAIGSLDAHAEHVEGDTCVVAGIRYDDRYVRQEGRWLLGERALQLRYFLPWDKFAGRYRHNAEFPPPPGSADGGPP